MRRLTLALTTSTLILAGTTTYYAREAQRLRAAAAVSPTAVSNSIAPIPGRAASEAPPAVPGRETSSPTATAVEAAPSPQSEAAAMRAYAVAEIPVWRRIFETPRLREKRRRDAVEGATRFYGGLREFVAMSDDEFRRLVNLLGDQEMNMMESQYRCALDESCDFKPLFQEDSRERRRQLAALLGEDRRQQLENASDNMQERNSVEYLRGMLPDTQPITDSLARELIEALGAERRKYVDEMLKSGATPSAIHTTGTGVTYPSTARTVEEKVTAAQEYQRRMRERASRILNTAQLEVFEQIQEDFLASARGRWAYEATQSSPP